MSEQQHVTESAGAYVLGALSSEEAQAVEAHAQVCEACRQDIRDLKEVAGVLPLSAPAVQPSQQLKSKIVAAAQSDEPAKQVLRRAAQRASESRVQHSFWQRPIPAWAGIAGWVGVAAACIVAGIFIGVNNERQRMVAALAPHTLGRAVTAASFSANDSAPEAYKVFAVSATQLQSEAIDLIGHSQVFDLSVRHSGDHIPAKIMQMPNENHAVLVSDMPAAPAGQVYRVWLIRKGKMHLGNIVAQGKMAKTMIPMKVQMGDIIAFSMAPIGSASLPTHFVMQQTL